ncbi:hypothetical protein [Pseudomonas luteola]|uniref:hypothetical protein n=1 Tax=Pseudomonas TaxID=286 RepID=UPI003DA00BBA
MKKIENSLNNLVLLHQKYQLNGGFQKNHEIEKNWPKELPLSPELIFLYENFEPIGVKIETGIIPIIIFSASDLKGKQIGYKWQNEAGNLKYIRSWPAEFLVIAENVGGGNPIIAATESNGTSVYASIDASPAIRIANNLADFIDALAILIDIVYGEFEIFEVGDDDGLYEDFIEKLQQRIEPLLGKENYRNFFDYFYG